MAFKLSLHVDALIISSILMLCLCDSPSSSKDVLNWRHLEVRSVGVRATDLEH